MTNDRRDSLTLPMIAFRGLWDKFAAPRSLGALRRAYARGVPSFVRCGYDGVDLADAIDLVKDSGSNPYQLPLYLVTPDGPDSLFSTPRAPFWADIFAVTMRGGSADTGDLARWDGQGWPVVGCYLSSTATRRGVVAEDVSGPFAAAPIIVFESANVVDDVVAAVREPSRSDDDVLAEIRAVADARADILRVSDFVELDLLAQRIAEAS